MPGVYRLVVLKLLLLVLLLVLLLLVLLLLHLPATKELCTVGNTAGFAVGPQGVAKSS